jgi:hypothetical protein
MTGGQQLVSLRQEFLDFYQRLASQILLILLLPVSILPIKKFSYHVFRYVPNDDGVS